MCVCVCVCVHAHARLRVCACVCMYVYMIQRVPGLRHQITFSKVTRSWFDMVNTLRHWLSRILGAQGTHSHTSWLDHDLTMYDYVKVYYDVMWQCVTVWFDKMLCDLTKCYVIWQNVMWFDKMLCDLTKCYYRRMLYNECNNVQRGDVTIWYYVMRQCVTM